MNQFSRRSLLAMGLTLSIAQGAWAQDSYPAKPITFVVPLLPAAPPISWHAPLANPSPSRPSSPWW